MVKQTLALSLVDAVMSGTVAVIVYFYFFIMERAEIVQGLNTCRMTPWTQDSAPVYIKVLSEVSMVGLGQGSPCNW